VNAAQLATYSQAKELILGTGYVKVCVKMNLNFTHGASLILVTSYES
jgi:hypothetical protein